MQDTPSQTQQATEAKSGVVALPLITRLIALCGAALFAVAAWLPWVILASARAGSFGQISSTDSALLTNMPGKFSVPLLTPGVAGAPPLDSILPGQGALFVWSALTVLGIPLATLAWMRVGKSIAWLIVTGYGLWLAVTLTLSITSAQYLLQSSSIVVQEPGTGSDVIRIGIMDARDPWVGLWLSAVALLICLAGLWLLISAVLRAAPSAELLTTRPRPTAQTPGAGTLTFGLVLWGVGFVWMAWASLGCPSFVLVSATCKGITADGAMVYAISRFGEIVASGGGLIGLDPLVGEYAISTLLAVGALFIVVGVWRRGVSAALCGWATMWLVVAAAFATLAWYGVNLVVNDPTLTGSSGGVWRGESGILFTAGALLIYLVGVGLLWFALLFHRTQTSSA